MPFYDITHATLTLHYSDNASKKYCVWEDTIKHLNLLVISGANLKHSCNLLYYTGNCRDIVAAIMGVQLRLNLNRHRYICNVFSSGFCKWATIQVSLIVF